MSAVEHYICVSKASVFFCVCTHKWIPSMSHTPKKQTAQNDARPKRTEAVRHIIRKVRIGVILLRKHTHMQNQMTRSQIKGTVYACLFDMYLAAAFFRLRSWFSTILLKPQTHAGVVCQSRVQCRLVHNEMYQIQGRLEIHIQNFGGVLIIPF